MNDLELLIQRAISETNPQARAVLWGECILYVLSLEDVREGLTFDEIREMSDADAGRIADHMQALFEMRRSWRDGIPEIRTTGDISTTPRSTRQHNASTKSDEAASQQGGCSVAVFADVFPKESHLRDYLAENLDLIGNDLTLVKVEFSLVSEHGADGSIDILASDAFGHFVVIEVKKSDAAARAALHEVSKYIRLLMQQEGLGRDEIRCVIISSEWHELLEPFSYFHSVADVQVDGIHIELDSAGAIKCRPVQPRRMAHLPTFSPEFDLFVYATSAERDEHWQWILDRAKRIPFVRVAMCLLDPKMADDNSTFRSIVCIWRIDDLHYEAIQSICGFSIGHLEPYAFPGWEPECDVLHWLASVGTTLGFPGTAEAQRGTAEKVSSLLVRYEPIDVLHCGRAKAGKTLNNARRVIELLRGVEGRLPVGRRNPVSFHEIISTDSTKSLSASIASFLDFVAFVPHWRDKARAYLDTALQRPEVHRVELRGFRKRHFFYALYQATEHPNADLSEFSVELRDRDNNHVGALWGTWSWDGMCPADALAAIEEVYGDRRWAVLSLINAVDENWYSDAPLMHGFHPVVAVLEPVGDGQLSIIDIQPTLSPSWTPLTVRPLRAFAESHPAYVAQIAVLFNGVPKEPGEGQLFFLV